MAAMVDQEPISLERAEAFSNTSLHLILLPTEKCNFRCVYCYEDFISGTMPDHVRLGINALIEARIPGLRHLSISWFGGEPLLAYSTILSIQSNAHALSRRFGALLHGSATTNAYLLSSERHQELSDIGVHLFQISLDGKRLHHDSTRVLASGKGTFEQIWSNLCAIHTDSRGSATCVLRLHLTNKNYESLLALVGLIVEQFEADLRFKVYFRLVDDYGGAGSLNASKLVDLDGTAKIAKLRSLLPPRMHFHQDSNEENICYAARANSWLIRSDGRIGKCTVALNDPRNTIGSISRTGELIIDHGKGRDWINPLLVNDSNGMACPWHALPVSHSTSVQSGTNLFVLTSN